MNAIETIDYNGFKIMVQVDESPSSPFGDHGDKGMTPMLVSYGRDSDCDYSFQGERIDSPELFLSAGMIRRHWKAITQWFDCSWFDIDKDHKAQQAAYGQTRDYLRKKWLAEISGGYCPTADRHISTRTRFQGLAFLWRLAGCAALATSIRGHCQGSYADVLAVQSPKWRDCVGAPRPTKNDDCERYLAACVGVYGAYVFGEVYGFTCQDSNGNELDGASCWGFYGDDHEDSGLLEHARSRVDCEIRARQRIADTATHDHFEAIGAMYSALISPQQSAN